MNIPTQPKIYHIVHLDRLESIIRDGYLWCDAEMVRRTHADGTIIGMTEIKRRRLKLPLNSHPDLFVGSCVPFYFCPRSVMLYLIYQANHPELNYHGGQEPIIHLEADLVTSVQWAKSNNQRWAFTLSNAGSNYFEDRSNLKQLSEINWPAVQTNKWGGSDVPSSIMEGKQAEFLMEYRFPWHLVERIGVFKLGVYKEVVNLLSTDNHRPVVEQKPNWYY